LSPTFAGLAHAVILFLAVPKCILPVEGMSRDTVRLFCLYGGKPNSAQDVYSLCDRLKVPTIHTNSVATQVINLPPRRDIYPTL
jgi:hypothetical protein